MVNSFRKKACILAYNLLAVPLMKLAFPVVSPWFPKLNELHEKRKGSLARICKVAKTLPRKKTLWFHVASVGEYLQARPVINQMHQDDPSLNFILTFSSPSGMNWAVNFKVPKVIDYVPIDSQQNVDTLLAAIDPAALILVKFDIWPNLVWRARARKIPIFLFSATLRAESFRLQGLAKHFYASVYEDINVILTVTDEDKQRFLETNPQHQGVITVGDTRTDSVLMRQEAFAKEPLHPLLGRLREEKAHILVVGSSWPNDEAVFLPGWQSLCRKISETGAAGHSSLLVIVPHEPVESHLRALRASLASLNLKCALYTDFEKLPDFKIDVLIINKVGVLAGLYRIGDVAYVGSGQGGVHNTMEPAAWKLPVLFGPNYRNSPEAIELLKRGAAHSVTISKAFVDHSLDWFYHPEKKTAVGMIGREFLEKSRGATYTCCSYLTKEINGGNAAP